MNLRLPLVTLAFVSAGAGAALADDRPSAADAGAFLPMETILAKAPGTLLEADLEKKRGVWVYEIKTMGADGRISKVMVDAKTGGLAGARDKAGSD